MRKFHFTTVVWMVCLVVGYGETEVRIEGMESKSNREIFQLIGGRLVYIRQKQASTWRANDAAFMVEQVLRNDGFYEAEVRGVVKGPEQILLRVNEGLRLSLGEVVIEGEGDSEELAKIFETPFKSTTPFGAGSPPFRADDVNTGLFFVTQALKAEGYWDAEVTLRKQEIDRETGVVDMVLGVDKGPRFKIGQPTVDSPDGRGVKRSALTWQPFIGQWASTENVNKLRAAMFKAFISRGYPDAEVRMNRKLGYDTYYPEFTIRLGTRVKLRDVNVTGLERTNPERVKRIMEPLKEGWYDEAAMNDKVKKLLGTGAFESVRLETSNVAENRINATLHFEEAKAKEVSFSAGVESFNGPLLRAKYTDRNFRGMLRGFSAGVELSGRGVLGEVRLTDPWWRGTDILRTHRLYSLIRAYEGYTTYENGFETIWQMDVTDHHSMELLLGYSFVAVTEQGLPARLLGDNNYGHTRVSFTQRFDYRDSKVLPKSGWHLNVPMKVGVAIGGETNTYVQLGLDGGVYIPLGDRWQLGIGGFASWVRPSGDIADLPVDLRVFNGGARSVRSYPERELGPALGTKPYGGDFSWAVNTEVSRTITGSVRAVAFLDAGGVAGDYISPREGGLELALGLGVRIDLPIGPVRLEYGYNLTRGPTEPTGTLHFAIGTTF